VTKLESLSSLTELLINVVHLYRATACNATHGIAKAFLSVCPFVKRVDCDQTKETCAHILIQCPVPLYFWR